MAQPGNYDPFLMGMVPPQYLMEFYGEPSAGWMFGTWEQVRDAMPRPEPPQMLLRDQDAENDPEVVSPYEHYSSVQAATLKEQLKNSLSFQHAVSVLTKWLEKGECNKMNSSDFFSMIHCATSQITRMVKNLKEVEKIKEQNMQFLSLMFNEINKNFSTIKQQKVWDHFTKAQRNKIRELMREIKQMEKAHLEEELSNRVEDEMDISEGEEKDSNSVEEGIIHTEGDKNHSEGDKNHSEVNQNHSEGVSEEGCGNVNAAVNSPFHFKQMSAQELEDLERIQRVREENLVLKQKLLDIKEEKRNAEAELRHLRNLRRKLEEEERQGLQRCPASSSSVTSSSNQAVSLTPENAYVMVCIGLYLNIHRRGSNVEGICRYLQYMHLTVSPEEVQLLLLRFPNVFKEELVERDDKIERMWKLYGFSM